MTSTWDSRLRLGILVAMLGAVAVIAYDNWDAVTTAIKLIGRASPAWLGAAVLAICGVYFCRAAVYAVSLRMLDHAVSFWLLWRTAIVATALHQLLPVGGASGYAYLTYAFHREGVPGGKASLVALVDTLSYAFPAATLVAISLACLVLEGGISAQRLLAIVIPGSALVALVVYLYRLQRHQQRFTYLMVRWYHRLASACGLRWSDRRVRRFLEQYYEGTALLGQRRRAFYVMTGLQGMTIACDFLALCLAFLALGVKPPLWVTFIGLVLAMAGLTVVAVPGGGGSFEVIMSTFFVTHGVAPGPGIAATVLYRVVAFWLPAALSLLVLPRAHGRRASPRAAPHAPAVDHSG